MAYASTVSGLLYPTPGQTAISIDTDFTIDAATEKIAMIGHVYWQDRASHTISAAGGGSIAFRTNTVTFAAAAGGTTVEIGIQDVATAVTPAAQPDGTFDVSRVLVSATDTITTTAWNTVTMTGGSGTKTMAHGDLIAVVWDMTARTAPDSVVVRGGPVTMSGGANNPQRPMCNAFTAGAWATGSSGLPNVLLIADDGTTLGTIDRSIPVSAAAVEVFSTGATPDERGIIFQVPWNCKIDGIFAIAGGTNSTSDFTLKMYSSPTSTTPTLVHSTAVLMEQLGTVNVDRLVVHPLATEIELTRNTDYIVALRATGATSSRLWASTLGTSSARALLPGGTTLVKGTRTDDTGSFSQEVAAVTIYQMGVRISQLDDGTGTGSVGGGITTYVIGG